MYRISRALPDLLKRLLFMSAYLFHPAQRASSAYTPEALHSNLFSLGEAGIMMPTLPENAVKRHSISSQRPKQSSTYAASVVSSAELQVAAGDIKVPTQVVD